MSEYQDSSVDDIITFAANWIEERTGVDREELIEDFSGVINEAIYANMKRTGKSDHE